MRPLLVRIRSQAFWLNFPTAMLILILQRTPVVKLATLVEEMIVAVPLGSVLRSAVVVTAGVGVHSIAGATELAASTPSPLEATVGTPVSVGFSITGTLSAPERWFVTGTVPPGLSFGGQTSGTILGATLLLSGTPTTAGSYSIGLRAQDDPTGTQTPLYTYQVNVTSAAATPPAFTTHPQNQTVTAGANVSFTSAATGNPAPTFQWKKGGADIPGATSTTLMLNNVQPADAATYTVVVTNSAGSATSNAAVLTVDPIAPPSITSHPAVQTAVIGAQVTFSVTAAGTGPLGYQWKLNGADIGGANGSTYTISTVEAFNGGTYTVVVTNAAGTATSNPAALTIDPTPRLINVSCRGFAGSGGSTLIMGFYINGTGSKTLLIRGIGPTLVNHNVPSVVADPSIVVYSGQTPIASNNDWSPALAPDFTRVGAFALVNASKDAAFKVTLAAPGLYTVHLVNSGPIAEALIEVYDFSRDLGSRLTNVSCRVDTVPNQVVILGTALVGGQVPVLARNIGPGLVAHGIPSADVLPDPHLRVYLGNAEIAVNDDWEPATRAYFVPSGAFDLTNGSRDAATRLVLNPGGYTVHATGKGGDGIALIEIYESP